MNRNKIILLLILCLPKILLGYKINLYNNSNHSVKVINNNQLQSLQHNTTLEISPTKSFGIIIKKDIFFISTPQNCNDLITAQLDIETILWLTQKRNDAVDEVCINNNTVSDIFLTDYSHQNAITYIIPAQQTFFKNARFSTKESDKHKQGNLKVSDLYTHSTISYLMRGYNPTNDNSEWKSIHLQVETLLWFSRGFEVKKERLI